MINPDFQERLMTALHDSVGYFNNGMRPTDAVIKSANEHNFNPDQATRLGETFNTARTLYHFDKAANSDDKCANFELVDNAEVVLNLFKAKEVKKEASLSDYSFYDKIPEDHTLIDIDIMPKKAEGADIAGLTLENQGNRIRRIISTYKGLAEEAFSKAASAKWEVNKILTKAANVLKQSYISKGTDMVDRLFFTFDDREFKPVLNKLAVALPQYLEVDASRRSSYGNVIEDRDLHELKTYIKRAKDLLVSAAEMTAVAEGVEKDASDLDAEFTSLFLTGCPAKEEGRISDFFTPEVKATSLNKSAQSAVPAASISAAGKLIGDFTNTLTAPVDRTIGSAFDNNLSEFIGEGIRSITGKTQQQQDNRKASDRLRNLQRTTLLEDLLTNDPIISDMDPRDVASIYQGIITLAPEVSTQREIVRSMIRAQNSQLALSPFDARQYADLEKVIRENTGAAPRAQTSMRA